MSSPADDVQGSLSFSAWLEQEQDEASGPANDLPPTASEWTQVLDDYDNPGLRIQVGSTVPLSYARQHARRLFVSTLHRLLPSLTDTLVSADGITLQNQADAARAAITAFVEALPQTDSDAQIRPHPVETLRSLIQDRELASESLAKHIDGWQKRYHLTDEWVHRAANDTLFIAAYFENKGIEVGTPLRLLVVDPGASLHEGRVRSLADIPDSLIAMVNSRHELTWSPVYIDDLKWSFLLEGDIEGSNGGLFAGFDPRTESIDKGVKRILPALEGRLRRVLERIAADDRQLNMALTIPHLRKLTAFEWLVRFQVFGHSRGDIARELAAARSERDPERVGGEDYYKSDVGKRIRKVAELIDLTLRET